MKMIVIIGAGESGLGCALLAHHNGYNVFVSDNNNIDKSSKNSLIENNIDFEENSNNNAINMEPDIVVKSPGIADSSKIVQSFLSKNIQVISEIEFASQFTDSEIIL